MTKKQRAKLIKKILDEYFPNPKIPLKYKNLYTLAIAVILSAQATDAKVNDVNLKVTAPDMSVYYGNYFSEGESVVGG